LIQALTGRGIIVSAGHSTATFDEAVLGFDAGIGYGTRLFNAMPAMHHREPGLARALLPGVPATMPAGMPNICLGPGNT
jgi:N-acetylglucosamine-6-phosphate deacetylase